MAYERCVGEEERRCAGAEIRAGNREGAVAECSRVRAAFALRARSARVKGAVLAALGPTRARQGRR
eukprot:6183653-Pleurochrysis_carterae.AAC.11